MSEEPSVENVGFAASRASEEGINNGGDAAPRD